MPGILLRVHVWRETLLELFHCWLIFYHSRVKWNQKNKTNKNNLYFPNWLFRTDIYGECNYFSGQNVINTPWGQNILWRLNPEIRIFWQHDFFLFTFYVECFYFLHSQGTRLKIPTILYGKRISLKCSLGGKGVTKCADVKDWPLLIWTISVLCSWAEHK